MINTIEAYTECGRKAAEARNQRDEVRAQHWKDYFQRMRNMEQGDDRLCAYNAYHDAYIATRNIPNATLF